MRITRVQSALVITSISLFIISIIQFGATSAGAMVSFCAATVLVGGLCGRSVKIKPVQTDYDPSVETYVPAVEEPRAELKELPIETVEGIGTKYGEMLRNAGIDTVSKLLTSKADEVAKICGVGAG
ncbi:MAG: helix-hairpin-helix domain-containing protein [Candidatus Thorarchaeota archaeon]|jgi:hypothetical protein